VRENEYGNVYEEKGPSRNPRLILRVKSVDIPPLARAGSKSSCGSKRAARCEMNTRKILGLVLLAVLVSVCILYGNGPSSEPDRAAGAPKEAPARR